MLIASRVPPSLGCIRNRFDHGLATQRAAHLHGQQTGGRGRTCGVWQRRHMVRWVRRAARQQRLQHRGRIHQRQRVRRARACAVMAHDLARTVQTCPVVRQVRQAVCLQSAAQCRQPTATASCIMLVPAERLRILGWKMRIRKLDSHIVHGRAMTLPLPARPQQHGTCDHGSSTDIARQGHARHPASKPFVLRL